LQLRRSRELRLVEAVSAGHRTVRSLCVPAIPPVGSAAVFAAHVGRHFELDGDRWRSEARARFERRRAVLFRALFAGLAVLVDRTVSRKQPNAVSGYAFAEAAEALAALLRQSVGFANAISCAGVGSAASQGTVFFICLKLGLDGAVPDGFIVSIADGVGKRGPEEKRGRRGSEARA